MITGFLGLLLATSTLAHAQTPARTALLTKMPELSLTDVALEDAIDFFRDATNANFTVDWRAIEEAGVSRDTPVTLKLRFVPTRVALRAALESAAPGMLTFTVEENVITITTLTRADARMFLRIYPVQDLLVEIPDFAGPSLSLTDNTADNSRSNTNRRRNGGGGNRGIFDNNDRDRDEEKSKSRSERAADLIKLIQTTIRPDIWDINGGKASITIFHGHLIVTAPKSVHEAIGGPVN
jgi:hypothetical protein